MRTLLGITLLVCFNANVKSQCSGTSLNVTINPAPGDRCGANKEHFSISNAPPFDEIRWKPGDGNSWTSVNTSASYNYQNPGTYAPKVEFLDANGHVICQASASPITIFDNPKADFEVLSPKVQCLPNNEFEFQSTSRKSENGAPITNWTWTMGIESKNGPNVNQSYATAGQYDVTLQITDTNGCTDLIVREEVVQVTKENHSYDTVTKAFCNHFQVPSGDTTLTKSTTYTDTIVNSVGCDSFITFDLTLINTACSNIDTTVCDSFQVPTSGEILTQSTTYLDTVTNSGGSDSIIAYNVTVEVPPSRLYTRNPEICMATVDDSSDFNVVKWERTSKTGVAGYNVYRQTDTGFTKVGSQDVNQLSQFVDSGVDLGVQSYSYYITLVDSCGNEYGSDTNFYETVHLQSSVGTNNEVSLNWNSYTGREPMYYVIYRQDSNSNQFVTLDSVNSEANSYTDFNAPNGLVSYRIGAVMPSTCVPTAKNATNIALSNILRENTTGIEEKVKSNDFRLYPNPAEDVVTVAFESKLHDVSIRLVDATGKTVLQQHESNLKEKQMDIGSLSAGIYIVEIETDKGVVQRKLQVQ